MAEPPAVSSGRLPASATILVVASDEFELPRLEGHLRRRYSADYNVVAERSAGAGLERLARLRDEGHEVAIILADQRLIDRSGVEFLSQAQASHRDAKRAVLVSWGDGWGSDQDANDQIIRAVAVGEIDNFLLKPVVEPDEQFHLAMAELLDDWTRQHRPHFEAIRIVGDQWSERSHGLRDALTRNAIPFGFYDSDSPEGRALLAGAAPSGPLPVAVFHTGRVIVQPTIGDIAAALGVNISGEQATFDLVVVGGGPAGLAAAVNAASDGLRVLVLETETIGGQAGSSSLIRNYLGFPHGLSGADLHYRAYQQAWLFGVKFLVGRSAVSLRTDHGTRILTLDDGSEVSGRAVVLAMGVSYRRMGIPSVDSLIGRGVFYGAATTEAKAMRGQDVFVVGGANSAGQAAIYLARFAASVTLVVRGPALAKDMSDYLVREIEALPNVHVRLNTEIIEARDDRRLRSLVLHDRVVGKSSEVPAGAVFVLIGAVPKTAWLPESIRRDDHGYILTGPALGLEVETGSGRSPLGTSLAGVFAAGDVRADSIKRVASSVGEGSVAIRYVHDYLARTTRPTSSMSWSTADGPTAPYADP